MPEVSQVPVSCAIFTLNEEINLPYCLESLRWCDDVVVVDSFSTDQTLAIARDAGARCFTHAFTGFGDQRNWCLSHVPLNHPWLLVLDADECVPPTMVEEFRNRLPAIGPDVAAFRVRRRLYMWRKWLRYSSFYPSWVVRLVKVGGVRFVNVGHAETQLVQGRTEALNSDLIDENHKGLEEWWERQVRYATAEALHEMGNPTVRWQDWFSRDPLKRRAAAKSWLRKLPARPFWYFVYSYGFRMGFRDGSEGLRFCLMKSIYQAMIGLKKYELGKAPSSSF